MPFSPKPLKKPQPPKKKLAKGDVQIPGQPNPYRGEKTLLERIKNLRGEAIRFRQKVVELKSSAERAILLQKIDRVIKKSRERQSLNDLHELEDLLGVKPFKRKAKGKK